MPLKSKLKNGNVGMFSALAFYVIAGILCFGVLTIADFRLVHIGLLGILNLVTAYGLLRSRIWTLWIVIALFLIATIFSVSMLLLTFQENLLQDVTLFVYLLLTLFFTAFIASNRNDLKN